MTKSISTPLDVAAAREQFVGLGRSYPPHPDVAVEPALIAGVDSTLTLFEGSTHVWPLKSIESDASRAALRAIGDHIRRPPSPAQSK